MPRSRPPYPPEFRRRMVELVRSGRTPEELAREFGRSSTSSRAGTTPAADTPPSTTSAPPNTKGDTTPATVLPPDPNL
ncbi:hypothetical protein C3Y87_12930 [Carbonactinospora thermoautotrophica]|nr:hypothetical protein [Carbonactinospora thermoautotrophica]